MKIEQHINKHKYHVYPNSMHETPHRTHLQTPQSSPTTNTVSMHPKTPAAWQQS